MWRYQRFGGCDFSAAAAKISGFIHDHSYIASADADGGVAAGLRVRTLFWLPVQITRSTPPASAGFCPWTHARDHLHQITVDAQLVEFRIDIA